MVSYVDTPKGRVGTFLLLVLRITFQDFAQNIHVTIARIIEDMMKELKSVSSCFRRRREFNYQDTMEHLYQIRFNKCFVGHLIALVQNPIFNAIKCLQTIVLDIRVWFL